MGMFSFFKNRDDGSSPKTAEQRKNESEKLLRSLEIPYIDHLPLTHEESDTRIRTPQEIAERILILTYLNYASEVRDEKETTVAFLQANLLWDKVSDYEKQLLQKPELTQQEKTDIFWRTEAVWLLLWVINKVDKLKLPGEKAEIDEIIKRLPGFLARPNDFIETATIRPVTEILDILDLTYRLHWAARNARLTSKPIPANMSLSIVMERHYAINWVTYYADNWDEITTDT